MVVTVLQCIRYVFYIIIHNNYVAMETIDNEQKMNIS